MYRIGFGYDVHRLVEGRRLLLGGVLVPSPKGALGHSDADVLIHAICDALLGALALGDIGRHFPDSSPEFKDIDSAVLLRKVINMIADRGYKIGNIDSTVILQQPRIAPYIPEIIRNLAGLMETEVKNVSVKATTKEGMGFTGKEEGLEAYAVALLVEK